MFNNRTKRAFKRYYRRINLKKKFMEKYICTVCDYVYDPELGDYVVNVVEASSDIKEKKAS